MIAISADPVPQAANLLSKLGLTFPVLCDEPRDVIKKFGVEDAENEIAWPSMFVIGPDKKILRRVMLETYKERPVVTQIAEILDEVSGSSPPPGASASAKP